MEGDEGMIVDIINSIKGTKSTAEISFEDLKVSVPGINIGVSLTGKIKVSVNAATDK